MERAPSLTAKQKFDRDRQYGEDLEERMLTALEWNFPTMLWQKHASCSGTKEYCHCFDLEDLATQRTIECKKDWTADETKNFCFELYLTDQKTCKADYLAHEPRRNIVYWFRMDDLRDALSMFDANGYKPFGVGDGKRTMAYVIDAKLFLANCRYKVVHLGKPLEMDMFE